MERKKEQIPEFSNQDQDVNDDALSIDPNDNSQELEQLFDGEEPKEAPEQKSLQDITSELSEKFGKQYEDVFGEVKSCRQEISRLVKEIKELKTADLMISDLSTRCRDLTEQFHEREIMLPIIHSMIRLANSCRQQIDRFQQIRIKHINCQNASAIKAITFLIDSRKTDLVEFENVLANLGAEPYQHHQDIFNPSYQKCINRIECKEENLVTSIAQRLLPGYKRHEKIVKKECVNVYVLKNEIDNPNNGGD